MRRTANAVKNANFRAWAAGIALAGAYVLFRALDRERERDEFADDKPSQKHKWDFWKGVLVQTYNEINNDHLLSLAAGVVFYALLALFPAITALVSSYALFANPSTISQLLTNLKDVMPESAYGIVEQQVNRIASTASGDLSFTFFISLTIAIWSANSGTKAIIEALNIVYGVKEVRGFIRLNIVSLILTLGTIIGLLLAIAAIVVAPIVFSYLPLEDYSTVLVTWLRWPILLVLLMFGIAMLYRFGPNRENPRWEWLSPGAISATVSWIAGSALLSWYLSNFANYGATYGSLGAAIGLMMWLWMSAIVVLVGAELNSEIDDARERLASERNENG